jgi:hypothetical protein
MRNAAHRQRTTEKVITSAESLAKLTPSPVGLPQLAQVVTD